MLTTFPYSHVSYYRHCQAQALYEENLVEAFTLSSYREAYFAAVLPPTLTSATVQGDQDYQVGCTNQGETMVETPPTTEMGCTVGSNLDKVRILDNSLDDDKIIMMSILTVPFI